MLTQAGQDGVISTLTPSPGAPNTRVFLDLGIGLYSFWLLFQIVAFVHYFL